MAGHIRSKLNLLKDNIKLPKLYSEVVFESEPNLIWRSIRRLSFDKIEFNRLTSTSVSYFVESTTIKNSPMDRVKTYAFPLSLSLKTKVIEIKLKFKIVK